MTILIYLGLFMNLKHYMLLLDVIYHHVAQVVYNSRMEQMITLKHKLHTDGTSTFALVVDQPNHEPNPTSQGI